MRFTSLLVWSLVLCGVGAAVPAPLGAADADCVSAGCHGAFEKAKVPHEAIDSCADCHRLAPGRTAKGHEGKAAQPSKTPDYQLTKPVPQVCWDCHDDDAEKTDNLHPPYEDGDCLECHDAHASSRPLLLKKSLAETCYGCHDEMEEQVETSRVLHDPMDDENSCATCHFSHGGDADKYLREPTVPKLCGTECHDDVVAAIEAVPADHRHGPVQKGECQACHDVHGSPHAKLLRGNYPDANYAPWNSMTYKGCFGKCHDPKAFAAKGPSGFRDREQNLHYLHVNRAKGRACRLCHDPHASPQPHLLREAVPFGKWRFDMHWKTVPEGASCAPACHVEKVYTGGAKGAKKEAK